MTDPTTPPSAEDTAVAIIVDAAFAGLHLDLRGDKIIARPEEALTPELRQRIVTHREQIIAWLTDWIQDGARLELKLLLVPLVGNDTQRLDDALAAWKARIDRGRADGESVADHERAALAEVQRMLRAEGVL